MRNNFLSFLLFFAAFLAPIQAVGLAIGFLVFSDLATGVWASLKEGKRFSSDRLGRSVTKLMVYCTSLVVGLVAQKYVFEDAIPIVKVVAGMLAGVELTSIGENLTRISGIDFRAVFKRVLPAQKDKEDRQ